MLPAELGAYLSAMLAQWQSANLQAIPDDEARLARICAGEPFPAVVREKFERVIIDGKPYLRNIKLAGIWAKQKAVHDAQVIAGKQSANLPAKPAAKRPAQPLQNPEPIIQNSERERVERSDPRAQDSASLPNGMINHPAVIAYWERFRLIPPIVAQERMAACVKDDLEGWGEILDYWQGNGHRPESTWKMIDRYEEQAGERRRGNGKAKPSIYDPVEQEKLKSSGARLYPDGFYRPY